MATAIAHQRNILEIQKPVGVLSQTQNNLFWRKKFEFNLVTQSL
jgi:hypothetical protein